MRPGLKQLLQQMLEAQGLTSRLALWVKGFGCAALPELEPAKPHSSGFA